MAERTCSLDDCEKPSRARGFCNSHYSKRRRAGLYPPAPARHRLSGVDIESRTADCSICGPDVRIHHRAGLRLECMTVRKRYRSTESYASKYGITGADYQRMFEDQQGVCAICRHPPDARLCVDHCHETGRVRGLLCARCNMAIGHLRDNPRHAASAAAYLLKTSKSQSV